MSTSTCVRCGAKAVGLSPDAGFGSVCPRCLLEGARDAGESTLRITPPPQGNDNARNDLPPEAANGERVGKYVKCAKLGAGGMGEVWKAWDTELRRWVALKFLKHHDHEVVARFRREAQMSAKLSHPNIASIYEASDDFIAMQFVDGITLQALPRHDPRLLVEVVRQAACAIHYAHEQGVVHRDVKPANIMVTGIGRKPATARFPGAPPTPSVQVYVMDFGLAKSMDVDSSLSVSGTILGTPSYMSPEQARGGREIDHRSDVYSLGATFYEMLAGCPPFRAQSLAALLAKVMDEEPKPVRKINPETDRDIETIVLKCLEKDPARRYATAIELEEDLSRWLAGEAIQAHPPSAAYRMKKFVLRRKPLFAVGMVGAIAVAAAVWTLLPRWLAARKEAETAARLQRDLQFYLPLERELDILRMKFYWHDFALTEKELGRYDDVIRRVVNRMGQTGETAHGWYLIGRCLEVKAQFAAADDAYAHALALDKNHVRTLFHRGRMGIERAVAKRGWARGSDRDRVFRKDAESATASIRLGLDLGGRESGMELDLARAYASGLAGEAAPPCSSDKPLCDWEGEPFAEEFLLAEALWTQDEVRVEELGRRMLKRMPSSYNARLCIARALMQQGKREDAMREYDEALKIHARLPEALYHRGHSRYQKGDFDGAIADLSGALESEPDFPEARVIHGLAHLDAGRPGAALPDFDAALRLDPRSKDAWTYRALTRCKLGDFAGAIDDYTSALAIDSSDGDLYVRRGDARRDKGDLEEAIKDYGKALEIEPHRIDAHARRGSVHEILSKRESAHAHEHLAAAATDYRKAAELAVGPALRRVREALGKFW